MINVINKTSELEIPLQRIGEDSSNNIRVVAKYSDVSVGDLFDCIIDLTDGKKIDSIHAIVKSITLEGKTTDKLPKGRGGGVLLEMNEEDSKTLFKIIEDRKVQLCRLKNIDKNTYVEKVISLESTENNDQVKRIAKHLSTEMTLENGLFYVARALYEDISIDQEINVIWNTDKCEFPRKNQLKIASIFYNSLEPQSTLIKGVPCLILLKKPYGSELLVGDSKTNLSKINSSTQHLMIGNRILLKN